MDKRGAKAERITPAPRGVSRVTDAVYRVRTFNTALTRQPLTTYSADERRGAAVRR